MAEQKYGRSAAAQRKQHIEALEDEKRGYEQRGLKDRAKAVDAQIKALTTNAKSKPEQAERSDEQPEQADAEATSAEQADADQGEGEQPEPAAKPKARGGRAKRA